MAAGKNVVIVAIGDSLTAGTPFFLSPLESPPDGQGDQEGQYTYWMGRRKPLWQVHNYGVRGERTDEIQARLDEALKLKPRYLVVLAGTNDILQGYPIKTLKENLVAIYRAAKNKGTIPVAVSLPPVTQATAFQNEQIRAINRWLQRQAEYERIPFCDMYAELVDPKNPSRLRASPDGMHPDVGGYRQMGLALVKVIDEMEAALQY